MKRTSDFRMTEIVWHEAGMRPLHFSNRILEVLNQLKIKEYGLALDFIFLILVIHLPTQTLHKEYKRHSRKYKNLKVQRKLDYEQFVNATDEEALEMMALSFLEVIEQFPKWKIKDFDWQRLHTDARKLFVEHRFIRENHANS